MLICWFCFHKTFINDRGADWKQSPLPNWEQKWQLLLPPHPLHLDISTSSMGNSTVSNLIKLIFTITVCCSGEENTLMHHDNYLFLCLLWFLPESLSCVETLLMLSAPQTWFRIHSRTQRANIWEILAAFVKHLSCQIQKYCKRSCILRQRTLSHLVQTHSLGSGSLWC